MSFDMSRLKVTLNPHRPPPLPADKLLFGVNYTPHMAIVKWTREEGWEVPEIKPFGPIPMHPGASVLHYGLEIFEGMKAYVGEDGRVLMFRPLENAKRMCRSAVRLCLPTYEPKDLVDLIERLVMLDRDYIPKGEAMSMYIRPTLISIDERLGVKAPDAALLYVILSPCGKYFSANAPMIYATSKYARAVKGGVGDCKCGGNYAPTIMPQGIAASQGCPQVLWLTPDDDKLVTEVGAMNFLMCFKCKDSDKINIITAPLDGMILPGITRMSIMELVREKFPQFEIEEKYISMADLAEAIKSGECIECFGCGTAAIVTPVAGILWDGERLELPKTHPIAEVLGKALMSIQYGETPFRDWQYVCKCD